MDKLPALGTNIESIVGPTSGIYAPLLTANATEIRKTERKTFQYGPQPRQALDVYYPPAQTGPANGPILLFCYGGGFVRGEKQLPIYPDGLVYGNIGHFFASRFGLHVVVPDYRLVGVHDDAKYPSGGQDVGLAIEWIGRELAKDAPRQLFLMGNSAGGVHVSTWLLEGSLVAQHAALKTYGQGLDLKGIVMVGVPFHFGSAEPVRAAVLKAYFDERVNEDSPLGLLEGLIAKVPGPIAVVRTMIVHSSLDPDWILEANRRFIDVWPDKSRLDVLSVEGHNHISTALALGTGIAKEELWGQQVGEWVEKTSNA